LREEIEELRILKLSPSLFQDVKRKGAKKARKMSEQGARQGGVDLLLLPRWKIACRSILKPPTLWMRGDRLKVPLRRGTPIEFSEFPSSSRSNASIPQKSRKPK
jgi:hypothetical protein